MKRCWPFFITMLTIAGCDTGTGGDAAVKPTGTYSVEQRCNDMGPLTLDLTPPKLVGNYTLLARGGGDTNTPSYVAVDRFELGYLWKDDDSDFQKAQDGLPLYTWTARLTKEPGWLKNADGEYELPKEASLAYDAEQDSFFIESVCGENQRDPAHAYQHQQDRMVLQALNLDMAKARKQLYADSNNAYIDIRREHLDYSSSDGVHEGHHDRNLQLLSIGKQMKKDAETKVPALGELIAKNKPDDPARAKRYQQELPAYLRAAARAHAHWYIDSADIRLDWFHGNDPEGETEIRQGMAQLEEAYLELAKE